MLILIVNMSQTSTDKANIVIANKYKVAYDLSIGIFVFDDSKVRGKCHAYVYSLYLTTVTDRANTAIGNK